VVTTRPQGYAGEFDELKTVALAPLSPEQALAYAVQLTRAWVGAGATELEGRLDKLRAEVGRAELGDLLRVPLHVAMVALQVARDGKLPASRWLLFDRYVARIFDRELRKNLDNGIVPEDAGILRLLHARAGLLLQMRGAFQEGARPLLLPRELRAMVVALCTPDRTEAEAEAEADRLLRFADERLVLLLRESATGYGFAVRSLQEFFAAEALREEPEQAAARVGQVALDPYWLNVVLFVASHAMCAATPHEQRLALACTAGVCEALDAGTVRREAAPAKIGTRLALAMLEETSGCSWPGLHARLWAVVMRGVEGVTLDRLELANFWWERRGGRVWNDPWATQFWAGELVAEQEGSGAEKRREETRALAIRMIERGGEMRRAGRRLLAGSLLRDDAQTVAFIRERAQLLGEDADLGGWRFLARPNAARAMVEALPAVFTPMALASMLEGGAWEGLDGPIFDTARLLEGLAPFHDPDRNSLFLLRSLKHQSWTATATFVDSNVMAWRAWAYAARFHQEPSARRLAEALQFVASTEGAAKELDPARIAWPLAACLEVSTSKDALLRLSARVEVGELGDTALWFAAEARWQSAKEMPYDDVSDATFAPWHVVGDDIIGLPPIWSARSRSDEPLKDRLALAARTGHATARRFLIRLAPQVALRLLPRDAVVDPHGPEEELRRLELIATVAPGDSDDWLRTLHAWGLRNEISPRRFFPFDLPEVRALASRLVPHLTSLPGLLVALLRAFTFLPNLDLPPLQFPTLTPDAPACVVAAAAALRLITEPLMGDLSAQLASLRGDSYHGPFDYLPDLAHILAQRAPTDAVSRLATLYDAAPDDEARAAFAAAIHTALALGAVPSFATPEEWARFGFPGTFPGRQPPPLPPVRLASIDELTNLRLFKDTPRVDAPLPTAPYDAGQWIVLLGENGVGKTTLLRALALALAPDGVATKLLDDRLPMVRNGGAASVRVTLDGRSFAVRVERDGAPPTERVVSDTVSERPWVVGYGVRRGNARGESDREPEQGPYGALHTLFERPGTLHHATRWILDLRRRLLEEEEVARKAGRPEHRGPERRTWDGVERALQRVLPDVQKVEAARDHVMVRHRRFGLVRLDALSDGYLTTAGWVVDLIARWVERQRARFEPVNDLLREMVGIVLLDEIDLHLHPVWQMRIIEDVRALFPRLSFVVTTHNPLALQGARKGEVFVMRHDAETGAVELAQRDILPGYDVDRVLLEQFGVAQTFDRETRRLLDEYRALRAQSVPVGHPRRRELEEELEVRLGPVGRRVVETQRGPEDAPRRMSAEESEAYRRELRARRGRT
jgi:energy-coupling factor transporter ATP-binding protein EcfA2